MATRTWGLAAGASLIVMITVSVVGGILQRRGPLAPVLRNGTITIMLLAFAVLATAVPPLALRAFLAGQVAIGNAAHPIVAFLLRQETNVVRAFWLLMAGGVIIALPVILRELGLRV